jgi:hypothetical protein
LRGQFALIDAVSAARTVEVTGSLAAGWSDSAKRSVMVSCLGRFLRRRYKATPSMTATITAPPTPPPTIAAVFLYRGIELDPPLEMEVSAGSREVLRLEDGAPGLLPLETWAKPDVKVFETDLEIEPLADTERVTVPEEELESESEVELLSPLVARALAVPGSNPVL